MVARLAPAAFAGHAEQLSSFVLGTLLDKDMTRCARCACCLASLAVCRVRSCRPLLPWSARPALQGGAPHGACV